MNPGAILNSQFIQIALPLLLGMFLTAWAAITTNNSRFADLRGDMNRRFDEIRGDMNRRFDEIVKRLDSIDTILRDHDTRITRVEERASPFKR